VEAILDRSQRSERYTLASFLANSGISTSIDARHAIAHNKIMIIDRSTVITGSFNFTRAAEEKNAENILIVKSKELAGIYIDKWKKHRKHSGYTRRGTSSHWVIVRTQVIKHCRSGEMGVAKTFRENVLRGFPWKAKFVAKREIDEYFSNPEWIQCLLYGRIYESLNGHLQIVHRTSHEEYV
jgi:phosphatidylserine/phosphatidylglycerophosphate/cardiolipin synthase-like enzyme